MKQPDTTVPTEQVTEDPDAGTNPLHGVPSTLLVDLITAATVLVGNRMPIPGNGCYASTHRDIERLDKAIGAVLAAAPKKGPRR